MAKITRVYQKIFGSNAGANEVGKFGSLAAGNPQTTSDPEQVQSLSQFLQGWFGAVIANNSPAIEDMNALFFLSFRQMAYLFQSGIPEWDDETEYHKNSLVIDETTGVIYQSIANDNTNNDPTDEDFWTPILGGSSELVTANRAITMDDKYRTLYIEDDDIEFDLPDASTSKGLAFTIKSISNTIGSTYLAPDGADLIEGLNDNYFLESPWGVWTFVSDGSNWIIQ